MLAFTVPYSLGAALGGAPVRSRYIERRNGSTIRCVAADKKGSRLVDGLDSDYYHVIQPEEDVSTLPPPPQVHRSVPFVGYVLEHTLGLSTNRTRAKRYGNIYRSNFFLQDFVYIADMNAQKDILKDTTNFTSKPDDENSSLAEFFGQNSLFLLDGPQHAALRKVLAPAFSPSMFSNYFDAILSATEAMWEKLSSDISAGEKVQLDPVFRQHYMRIIIQVSSGIDASSDVTSRLGKLFTEAVAGIVGPKWGPLFERTKRHRAEIADTLRKVIADKLVIEADIIETLRKATNNESSMLAVKEQLKKGMDITQVAIAQTDLPTGQVPPPDCPTCASLVDLLMLVWGAGFFTSAATTACAAFEAGMAPEKILSALVAEQDSLVGSEVDSKEKGKSKVTYEQILNDMPLLDSYVTEILRLYPAGTGMIRTVKKDVVILGKTVKAGSTLFMDLIASLADDKLYPEAEQIKVDRWLNASNKDSLPKPIAFGGPKSPHYCVGAPLARLVIKTTLAVMLRNYRLVLDPNQSRKYRMLPDYTPASLVSVKSLDKRM